MTAIKEASTFQENKRYALDECPAIYLMEKISGHWKPIILFDLLAGPKRYGALKKSIPAITEKVLNDQLKQLEKDGLIIRKAKAVIPPQVTYQLSKKGRDLKPVFYAMATWTVKNSDEQSGKYIDRMAKFPA